MSARPQKSEENGKAAVLMPKSIKTSRGPFEHYALFDLSEQRLVRHRGHDGARVPECQSARVPECQSASHLNTGKTEGHYPMDAYCSTGDAYIRRVWLSPALAQ